MSACDAVGDNAVLLIVLDGMRLDYLERHRSSLPTLDRLQREGAWFPSARVNFLPTVTALGHASIGTGADPQLHGIVLNTLFDQLKGRPQSPYPDKSPRNLMVLTLADLWNLQTGGRAVIITQGGIFAAAAGLAGHGACLFNARPTILASYSSQGSWETNPECYKLPEYLKDQKAQALWESVNGQWMGHDVSSADAFGRSALFSRFEGDALVAMIENEPIGADDVPDLVLANLKVIDFVGHAYGPDSAEMEATLAEQDRQIGRILQALEKKAGRDRFMIVLTADLLDLKSSNKDLAAVDRHHLAVHHTEQRNLVDRRCHGGTDQATDDEALFCIRLSRRRDGCCGSASQN